MGKVPQQTIMTAITAIVIGISIVAMIIPQAAYAQQDNGNPSLSSDDNCASNELPASINGTIQCMQQRECYSEQFEGKEAKHCNFMMSNQ